MRVEKVQRIKSLLEIKNLAMEIAIKEKREFTELPSIISEKALINELFKKQEIAKYRKQELGWKRKMAYGLTGSMAVVVVLMIINLIYSPNEVDNATIVLRDLGIGVAAGLLMAFYPGNTKKSIIVAGCIAPFIVAMLLILFRMV